MFYELLERLLTEYINHFDFDLFLRISKTQDQQEYVGETFTDDSYTFKSAVLMDIFMEQGGIEFTLKVVSLLLTHDVDSVKVEIRLPKIVDVKYTQGLS